jgi:hypothetical protein
VARLEKLLSKPTKHDAVACEPKQFPCPYYASGKCGGAEGKGDAIEYVDFSKDPDADVLRAVNASFLEAAAEQRELEKRLEVVKAIKTNAFRGAQGFLAAKGVPNAEGFAIDGIKYRITTVDESTFTTTRKGYTYMQQVKDKKKAKGGEQDG